MRISERVKCGHTFYELFEDDAWVCCAEVGASADGYPVELSCVSCADEFLRKGYTTFLLRHIIERHPRLWLWCYDDNEPAKGLYCKLGFVASDEVDEDNLRVWTLG